MARDAFAYRGAGSRRSLSLTVRLLDYLSRRSPTTVRAIVLACVILKDRIEYALYPEALADPAMADGEQEAEHLSRSR